jgi:Secretion system C-terminal sorting domain
MTQLSEGVFSDTLMLVPGVYEFYYTLNNGAIEEQMSDGVCMVNSSSEYHRIVVVSEATSLPQVCWQSCYNCATSSVEQSTFAWSVYPNPAAGNITLNLKGEQQIQVIFFDSMGKQCLEQTCSENCQLNTEALSNGFYYLHLRGENVFAIQKIAIEK